MIAQLRFTHLQATATPTVQYGYARLVAYLCKTVPDFLMKHLLPKLRETHESRITLDDTRLQYLATFFAELYTHVENVRVIYLCII